MISVLLMFLMGCGADKSDSADTAAWFDYWLIF